MQFRPFLKFALFLSLLGGAVPLLAETAAENENRAREELSKRLLKLSQTLDMKEAKYEESGASGKAFDANTGNSFLSNMTIHYNVESVCREWIGSTQCKQWLDPFISEHGFGGDFSPLEGVVAQAWKQRQTIDTSDSYRIWEVKRDGGGRNTDPRDQKFDRSGITDWRLLPEVQKKVAEVGEQTAVRQIALTYDDDAPKNGSTNVMPNMEALRMVASRWTKMFRNRLVANLADMRVGDQPTEFLLNEERPDCESYVNQMKALKNRIDGRDRYEMQAELHYNTEVLSLQQRYKACVALRKAPVDTANAQAVGDKVAEGDPESERIDKWRTRLNIAAIDRVGIDVNSLPKPSNAAVARRDLASEMAVWDEGGQKIVRRKALTNAQQLESYNNNLELAAVGMKEVAMRSGNIVDNSKAVQKHKIQNGQVNAVRLNSLTSEMRNELKETSMRQSGVMKGTPENNLEQTASELAITRR